jgi:hypothetical protein
MAEVMQAMLEQKLATLEGVLTTDQLDAYRRHQEVQVRFMEGLISQMDAPAMSQ